jgi:uncharacterized protein
VRVLVSGARGLIGAALSAELLERGDDVITLDRPGANPGPSAGGVRAVPWDPAAGAIDREALGANGPYDAVVHLAGAGLGDRRWSRARRDELVRSRVDSTRLIVAELGAMSNPPGVLVNASAIGIYGERGDELLTEESGPGDGFLAELCQQWEAATRPAADAGIRVVCLRSGIVLSARGGALARQLPLFRLGLGARLGSGRQYVSWISLVDEVGAIRRAIDDRSLAGPLNATAPEPVTNAVFTRALGRAVHRPTVLRAPGAALALALGAEMAKEMLLAGQRVVPAKLLGAGHRFAQVRVDEALAAAVQDDPRLPPLS